MIRVKRVYEPPALKGQVAALHDLRALARTHRVITLVYAAADTQRNNAVVLAGLLKHRSGPRVGAGLR